MNISDRLMNFEVRIRERLSTYLAALSLRLYGSDDSKNWVDLVVLEVMTNAKVKRMHLRGERDAKLVGRDSK